MKAVKYVFVAVVVCCGCASPLVKYTPITSQDLEGLTKFRLAESLVKFDFGKTPSGLPTEDIIISSVPIPHGERRYGLSGTGFFENWGVVTVINTTFRGDSDLIQQISVVVTDQRQQALQSLTGTAIALGSLFSVEESTASIKLPKGISVTNLLSNPPSGCVDSAKSSKVDPNKGFSCTNQSLEGTVDFVADITLSKVPDDAIPASVIDAPYKSGNYLYSACRSFTITLKPQVANKRAISATLAVADPRFLQTLRFPDKGSITVAPSCGAHSLAQDANLPTAIDYLNTLATQAKAIKEAFGGSNSGVSGNTKSTSKTPGK